jgi:hypothetical protein
MSDSDPTTERGPWLRLPEETAKSYAAFMAYLGLGPRRSIARAMELVGAGPGSVRQWERWSSKYNWVARAEAYDDDRLLKDMQRRERDTEIARQAFLSRALDNVAAHGDIARGRMPLGDAMPVTDKHGKVITYMATGPDGEEVERPVMRPLIPASVRLSAIQHELGVGGIDKVRRMELTGKDGDAIRLQAHVALAQLDPDKLVALAAAFGVGDDGDE